MAEQPLAPAALHPNLAHLLWDAADASGARAAVIERERTTDYASLRARAAAIAASLRAGGVEPGERIGILLDRGADAIAAFFGVVAAGGVAINVNESLRPRQIENVLAHASAKVLLTSSELLSRQPRPIEARTTVLDIAMLAQAAEFVPVARLGADLAQISYTSGSTGQPKGVTLTHGNLWAVMHAVTTYLDLTSTDRIASLLPFSFVYGLNQVLCALGSRATLVVERSPLPQQMVASLRARGVTVLAAVPPLWTQLLGVQAFRAEPLLSLRIATNAGGRIPPEVVRAIRRAQPNAQLFLMYGLTEALRSTYLPPTEVDRRPDSIGRAIPGAEIMVLRDDLTPCAAGEVGELVQRGPTVALGYWNDPDGTARVFRPNPLRPPGAPDGERVVFSGDLVRADEDGYLYFVGRRDRMIKTLGYRVSPDEICDVLYASGEIVEGVVTSEPDEQRGERIIAFVVLTETGSLKRLQAVCAAELPRYMQPARIDVMSTLPRTSSGKFDLRAAQELAVAGQAPGAGLSEFGPQEAA
ncbi:MAG: AMP-binding protein, partial [Chloroflexota bacterium]|nr:AMP-binding protein [Chloroflexota bacterium]